MARQTKEDLFGERLCPSQNFFDFLPRKCLRMHENIPHLLQTFTKPVTIMFKSAKSSDIIAKNPAMSSPYYRN